MSLARPRHVLYFAITWHLRPPPCHFFGRSVTRWPIFRHPLPAYGCALGLTVIALLIRWIFDASFGNSARMLFFLLAAALSAFLFGRGPGIFSTLVGTLMGNYFFFLPRYAFHFQARSATVTFLLAVIEGVIISICAGYLHRALQIRDTAESELRHLYEAERRAHEAADELNRTKDYFLAVLSHELRGPLSAISYCVADRLKDPAVADDVRADFALIDRNAHMQSRLIDDLLDLTRLTRGKLEIELQPLDLHLLLAEAVRTAGIDRQLVGSTPTLHLKAGESRIQGDRDRLLQVFWNILRNAAKFTPPDGHIDIETSNPRPGPASRCAFVTPVLALPRRPSNASFTPSNKPAARPTKSMAAWAWAWPLPGASPSSTRAPSSAKAPASARAPLLPSISR